MTQIPAASLVGRLHLADTEARRERYDECLGELANSLTDLVESAQVMKSELARDYQRDGEKTRAHLAAVIEAGSTALWFAQLARRSLPGGSE